MYPYFRTASNTWRNAIRHNLSVNECFIRCGRAASGRGYYWYIHPQCIDMFRCGEFRSRNVRRKVNEVLQFSKTSAAYCQALTPVNHNTMTSVSRNIMTPVNQNVKMPVNQNTVIPVDHNTVTSVSRNIMTPANIQNSMTTVNQNVMPVNKSTMTSVSQNIITPRYDLQKCSSQMLKGAMF